MKYATEPIGIAGMGCRFPGAPDPSSFWRRIVAGKDALLRQACQDASVDPRDVKYVEVQGTGTSTGDPIEDGALGSVFEELAHSYKRLGDADIPVSDITDIAYTLSLRLTLHQDRLALVREPEELRGKLNRFLSEESRPGATLGRTSCERAKIRFVFPAPGGQ